MAKAALPQLRMIVVFGPRLNPKAFKFPNGVEVHRFVPDLDRQLAACDLAPVQGGRRQCCRTYFEVWPQKKRPERR